MTENDNGVRDPIESRDFAGPQDGNGAPQEASGAAEDAEVEQLRTEVAELKDRLLRMAADADNFRKRAEREKAEATLYAATGFARDLLSVPDNLARALAAVPPEVRETADEAVRNLLEGIEVTERDLLNVLQRHGIRRIDPRGEKFDPHFHQAMFEVPGGTAGTVAEVVQPGYAIGDRCLRPAMVGVARG